MRGKYLFQRNLFIAGVVLFLLTSWNGIWQPMAVPIIGASTQVNNTAASDAERLKITLEVLESEGTRLSKGDCKALGQARDITEALLALAPKESENYRRAYAEWITITIRIHQICHPNLPSASGSGSADGYTSTVIVTGGGGCIDGMIAELLTQNPAFIQEYAEQIDVKFDSLPSMFNADRILLDVTPNASALGDWGTNMTVRAECGSKGPGVKGMSEAILAYPFLPQSERQQWMEASRQAKFCQYGLCP